MKRVAMSPTPCCPILVRGRARARAMRSSRWRCRLTALTSSRFASSTASKLIVDSISLIFTSRMACDSQGGSLPLLIAVFEGRHFPRCTLPTRSNGILIASVPTASSMPSKMALCLIAPSVNSASPRNPYQFINSIHFSRASRTLFEPSFRLVRMETNSHSSSSAL